MTSMTNDRAASGRPTVAFAMGDPAGVGAEITARLLADPDVRRAAHIVIFGDADVLQEGARVAGVGLDVVVRRANSEEVPEDRPVLMDLAHGPREPAYGEATQAGGAFATANFRRALLCAAAGRADAVVFSPFNKAAMRMAYPAYDDDVRFVKDVLDHAGDVSEFNVLGTLWNARVTSHIPLGAVAGAITRDRLLNSLRLTDQCMRAAGFARPRIAVAALNPHAGDGGNFGREEIDVIGPATAEARAVGLAVEGPFPSDTVFLRARSGAFDAVLTMYHDQGQIAMKLMGFERGVTLLGGLPFPICTPAHGTAYDIAGKGTASAGAGREAFLLAAKLASEKKVSGLRMP